MTPILSMTEIEIGSNLVLIISLIINAVLVPVIAIKTKECKHLKQITRGTTDNA